MFELSASPLGDLPLVIKTAHHQSCKIIAADVEFFVDCRDYFVIALQKFRFFA